MDDNIRRCRGICAILLSLGTFQCFAIRNVIASQTNELVTVIVIYRHGDRTPVDPYPNDPYGNVSLWPVGFGQLTNLGKLHQYELGTWLRQRYRDFLPEHYDPNDIYVRSTDVDRTLMSAYSNLAGLYPPKDTDDIWNRNIAWQPIPVHTTPEQEDIVLAMKTNCPRYNVLTDQLFEEPFFKDLQKQNQLLYKYVTQYTGRQVDSIESLEFIYNTLFIEDMNNFTLPEWTRSIYPKVMAPLAALSFSLQCYNTDLARLKVGPFMYEVLQRLQNAANPTSAKVQENIEGKQHEHARHPLIESKLQFESLRKMWVYSAHDTTIANVLSGMHVFRPHSPPFSSTILIELRRNASKHYVNVFYKNGTEADVELLAIPGCDGFNCDLEAFANALAPVVISVEDWYRDCEQMSVLSFLSFESVEGIVVFALCVIASMFIMMLVICMQCAKSKGAQQTYLRLPDDDIDNRI